MKKVLKRNLPFLLVFAMIAGLLPAWTIPAKAAFETTISKDTTYNGTYHISQDTTLYITKGATLSADDLCFDGDYTLTLRGAGTLKAGNITTSNSAVKYILAIESGRVTTGDIYCDYDSKIFIDGGSFHYNNIFPYHSISLSSGSPVYCATITVAGLSGIADVTYSVDGGSPIESSTDEKGKLYLWLTEGSHTISVSDGTNSYSAWLPVDHQYAWQNIAARSVAAAENSINDKSLAITKPGSYVITGSGSTSNTIMVNGDIDSMGAPVNITLDNVDIDASASDGCAFSIGTGSHVSLTLRGTNRLKSGEFHAGLNVPEGTTIRIEEDPNTAEKDSLVATGEYGAGIGANRVSSYGGNGGIVIIQGGKITAESSRGAGIGGAAGSPGSEGVCGVGGALKITGGTVTASSEYGAGIGGGGGNHYEGAGGTVAIWGGTVTASSVHGAGIGRGCGGDTAADPGTCVITGGSVRVNGGNSDDILYLEPASMYCDNLTDKTPACLTTVTVGAGPVKSQDVTYTVDGGGEIETSTDAEGRLFLWLAEGSHTLAISDGTENYSASLIASSAGTNETTANAAAAAVYSIENDCVVISKAGNYIINGTGSLTANTITINYGIKGIVNVRLNNVNIDVSADLGTSAFQSGGTKVNLTLDGSNTLKSGCDAAGLSVESGSSLTISEDSTTAAIDSLTAIGGENGAGMGGGFGVSGHGCGNVTIYGGTVNAYGGTGSAGIGGGYGGHFSGGAGGNVKICGGTVKAVSGSGDGYDTPADIGHGIGADGGYASDGSVTISGGSVNVTNMGPSIVYYDDDKTPAYLTPITVGADPVKSQDVTYTLNGGQKSIPCSTDENGLLYLWLPESTSSITDISAAGIVYEAAGAITTAASGNARTALAIPKITTPPTASGIYSGSALSSSLLTGGAATGINGVALTGTFTWTNPAAIVSSSGSYSVTFKPDNSHYRNAAVMVSVNLKSNSSSGGNNSTETSGSKTDVSTSDGTTTATTTVVAKTGTDGTAAATVTAAQISDALAYVSKAAASQKTDKQIVKISIDGASSAAGVSVTVPQTAIASFPTYDTDALAISAPIGSVTFDRTALDTISKKVSGDVTVTISRADTSSLTGEKLAAIGGRPVYNLSITSGGTAISDFGGGTATVSVPYKLADGEDPNKVVVYYISSSGELIMVPNCIFDAATGKVTFTTTHFSTYAIGYHDVRFADVSGWYQDYVYFLAARDIISGTGDSKFSPNENITRAQFVTILANLSGDDLSGYTTSSFTDVNTTDWYCKAVEWAFKNKIAAGSVGRFNPNANITREQMAILLYNYAKYAGLDVSNVEGMAIREFNDYENISDWAMTPIRWALNTGILVGNSNGSYAPKAGATRSEAAKVTALLARGMIK